MELIDGAEERVLTDDQSVLRELFVEAFLACGGAVQIEVEGLCW